MFNPNWSEITKSLANFSQILINLGLFLALWATFELCLLICSYLWKFSAVINRIIWANFKAPFQSKPAVKAPAQSQETTQPKQPSNHEPKK